MMENSKLKSYREQDKEDKKGEEKGKAKPVKKKKPEKTKVSIGDVISKLKKVDEPGEHVKEALDMLDDLQEKYSALPGYGEKKESIYGGLLDNPKSVTRDDLKLLFPHAFCDACSEESKHKRETRKHTEGDVKKQAIKQFNRGDLPMSTATVSIDGAEKKIPKVERPKDAKTARLYEAHTSNVVDQLLNDECESCPEAAKKRIKEQFAGSIEPPCVIAEAIQKEQGYLKEVEAKTDKEGKKVDPEVAEMKEKVEDMEKKERIKETQEYLDKKLTEIDLLEVKEKQIREHFAGRVAEEELIDKVIEEALNEYNELVESIGSQVHGVSGTGEFKESKEDAKSIVEGFFENSFGLEQRGDN